MNVENKLTRNLTFAFLTIVLVVLPCLQKPAAAQYKVTNLVSNQAGKAKHLDPNLVNAWGIALFSTGPFWVSDNGTGLSTVYDGNGVNQGLVVTIPPASGNGKGSPTGIVANSTSDFVITQGNKSDPALFLFATLDGTISGWNYLVNPTQAILAVNNSSKGSSYTGLAKGTNKGKNFIYAADNGPNNRVDIFDGSFNMVGSFTDSKVPPGFAAYGIRNIGGKLYVTFAKFGTANGVVDIFDTAGNFIKRFASGGKLNTPWGLALAPSNFGPASNALLVGNLGDGRINVFNVSTGKFMGQLKNTKGAVISINGLWGLNFGGGNSINGKKNQLFFSAGPGFYGNGLFGVIAFQ